MAAAASRRFRLSQSNNFYRDFGNFLKAAVHKTKIRRKIFLVVFISDLQNVYYLIPSFCLVQNVVQSSPQCIYIN